MTNDSQQLGIAKTTKEDILATSKFREEIMDVSNLAKGIYMVEITTTSHLKSTKKLVIN